MSKKEFLKTTFIQELEKLDPSTLPQWGKMNVQQMIEHMSDAVSMANKKIQLELHTHPDQLLVYRGFMLSDKPFRPNTKNALLGDEPQPVNHKNKEEAIEDLKKEIDTFFRNFESNPGLKVMNPIFGELDFDEWVHLFKKHAQHHLLQFGITT